MKLLFSEPRKSDECTLSYLIRLSECNGFRSPSKLLFYAGLKWKNNRLPTHTMLTGEFDLNNLLGELGIKPIGETKISNFYKLFKTKIDTPRILSKQPKICPACIREKGYAKESWNLLPVTCCTKHKIMLIDKNNQNGKMLSWYRPHLAFFDSQHKIELEIKAPTKLVTLSRIFERLLKQPSECKIGPKILKGLTANECLSVLNFIAHFQAKMDGSTLINSTDNLNISARYESAFTTLINWPEDFHLMLSTFINDPMTDLKSIGIRRHFRTLHDQLYLQRENRGIERIKDEFEKYLQENWPTVLNPNRLKRISIEVDKKQYLSITEARKILSCRSPKLYHLVKSKLLSEYYFKGQKYYKRIEVEHYLNTVSNNWSFNKACKELHISKHKLQSLLKSKIILAIHEPSSTNRDWLIEKKSITILFSKLRNNAVDFESTSKVYSLEGFLKSGYTFENIIQMMLDKKVEFRFLKTTDTPYSFKQFIKFNQPR